MIAVRGNIDERAPDLPDSVSIDIRADGESVLTLLLMHIAVVRAEDPRATPRGWRRATARA